MSRGKVVLITGGSRGIGAATARLAASAGWSVALTYREDQLAAERTAEQVRATGVECAIVQADVTDETAVSAAFDAADDLGPLQGVVNNAGIVAPSLRLAEMDSARIRRVLDVNVLGALLVAREAARRLKRGGSIVNVSSAAARMGSPGEYIDYAASKGAVDTLTLGLAKELAPDGIRVNAVRPGLIETELHASGGIPDRAQRLGKTTPLGRPGTADEVAETIVWLLSAQASYVTAALLDVAGGR